MAKILVVEDDRTLGDALRYNLVRENHVPILATSADAAIELARRETPDLILLDIMLPGGSGFDVCRAIRTFSTVPIIMLTARDDEVDRVLGLEIGADDYVTKPFSLRELQARIRAHLRRQDFQTQSEQSEVIRSDGLVIDVAARQVTVAGRPVTFQPREFDLLLYFVQHPNVVLTRDALLHAVWGHDYVGSRTVDVHVRRIRAKLEAAGTVPALRTVHGVGYVFDQPETGHGSDVPAEQ